MNPMTLEAARLIVRAPAPTLGELSVALAVLKDSPHPDDQLIAREWRGLRVFNPMPQNDADEEDNT